MRSRRGRTVGSSLALRLKAGPPPPRSPGLRAGCWRCAMQPNGSAAHSADTPNISDAESDAEVLRLAGLQVLAYGRERKPAREKLGLSLAWLDKVDNKQKAALSAEIAGIEDRVLRGTV